MSRSNPIPTLLTLGLTLLWASAAEARIYAWEMTASEDQVNNNINPDAPPDGSTDSTATGVARIQYDTKTRLMTYEICWDGLEGLLSAIHVHGPAGPGQSTMPHLFNVFTAEDDVIAAGVDRTTGCVEAEVKLRTAVLDTRSPFDVGQVLRFMIEDRGYVNIHSTIFPRGEIRADMVSTPDSARPKYTDEQVLCSETLHDDFLGLVRRSGKDFAGCIEAVHGGGEYDAETCGDGGRFDSALDGFETDVRKRCGGFDDAGFNEYPFIASPDNGPMPTGGVDELIAQRARNQHAETVEDLFGDDAESLVDGATEPEAAACQSEAWKRVRKCEKRLIDEFATCVVRGLAGGRTDKLYDGAADPFRSDADVEGCLGFDRKGRIAAACDAPAIAEKLGDACGGVALDGLFGDETLADLEELGERIGDTTRCGVCTSLNAVDGVDADCEC